MGIWKKISFTIVMAASILLFAHDVIPHHHHQALMSECSGGEKILPIHHQHTTSLEVNCCSSQSVQSGCNSSTACTLNSSYMPEDHHHKSQLFVVVLHTISSNNIQDLLPKSHLCEQTRPRNETLSRRLCDSSLPRRAPPVIC